MLRKLTYQHKFIALMVGVFVLGLLFWRGSLKSTFELMNKSKELEKKIQRDNVSSSQLAEMKKEDEILSAYLGAADLMKEDVKNSMINEVLDYCEGKRIEIIEVPESHVFQEEEHKIVTNRIKVKGAFIDLMLLNHHLEQEFKEANVSGVNFEMEKDKRTRKNELYAEIYLQNITQLN
ncbi:MAG: hypothetical protein AAF487_04675 [Bacteroidota bacterium]